MFDLYFIGSCTENIIQLRKHAGLDTVRCPVYTQQECHYNVNLDECKAKMCEPPAVNSANYRSDQNKCCVRQCVPDVTFGGDDVNYQSVCEMLIQRRDLV